MLLENNTFTTKMVYQGQTVCFHVQELALQGS